MSTLGGRSGGGRRPRLALRLRLLRRMRWASLPSGSDERTGLRRYAAADRPGLAGGTPVGGRVLLPSVPSGALSWLPPWPLLRCLCRRMICSSSGDMPTLPVLLEAILLFSMYVRALISVQQSTIK